VKAEPFEPADWREYRAIRLAALADAPDAFSSTLEGETQFSEADWRQRLADRAQFVVRQAGRAVGTAGGYAEDGMAHLVAMWVAPDWRGRGVGDVLIPAVLGWARQAGCLAVSLWVTLDNKPAQRLYARHGFRETGATQPVRPDDPDRLEQEMMHTLVTAAPAPRPA
jgi:GNAT superfamily N-acetyltransferase